MRARCASGLELERETEWKPSLPTAPLKCQKNTHSKKQTHALSLFTASGTRGKQPVPLNLQPAKAAGHESFQQPGRLAVMGYESRLVTEELYPPRPPPSPLPPPQPRDKGPAKSQPCRVWLLGTTSSPEGHKGMAGTKHPQPRELAALHQLLLNADDNDEQAELQFKTWPQPTATAPSAAVAQLPAAWCVPPQGCDGAFPPQGTMSPLYPAWTLLPDPLPHQGWSTEPAEGKSR